MLLLRGIGFSDVPGGKRSEPVAGRRSFFAEDLSKSHPGLDLSNTFASERVRDLWSSMQWDAMPCLRLTPRPCRFTAIRGGLAPIAK